MKTILTASFVLICLICSSQRNGASLFFTNMKSREIVLADKSSDAIYNLPFHNVQIWDARPDTTLIDYIKYANGTNNYILKKGFRKHDPA